MHDPARSGPGDSEDRRKRRRTSRNDPDTPGGSLPDDFDDEQDVPESAYDLTYDTLGEGFISKLNLNTEYDPRQ